MNKLIRLVSKIACGILFVAGSLAAICFFIALSNRHCLWHLSILRGYDGLEPGELDGQVTRLKEKRLKELFHNIPTAEEQHPRQWRGSNPFSFQRNKCLLSAPWGMYSYTRSFSFPSKQYPGSARLSNTPDVNFEDFALKECESENIRKAQGR